MYICRENFTIMIPRYSRPEMSAVWTEENKFGAYLKVEIEAAAAWSQLDSG